MSNKSKNQSAENPADIAREAFRRLATRRIAPTPDAYRGIYNEIAGITEEPPPPPPPPLVPAAASTPASASAEPAVVVDENAVELMLVRFSEKLTSGPGDEAEHGNRLARALKLGDWDGYGRLLTQMLDRQLKKATPPISLVDPPNDSQQTKMLRDLLSRTLNFALASTLQASPEMAAEAEALGTLAKYAQTDDAYSTITNRLKQLCYNIELKTADMAEQQELLLRLFKLLLENVTELMDDDSWLRGQIDVVQSLLSGPLDQRALEDATRSLKDVIYKQSQLKHSLSDAKSTVKNMMITFIDRLGTMATSTGDFHEKIGGFTEKISHASNIAELNQLLDEVLHETRTLQTEALRSRDKMVAARQEVQDSEERIHALEAKLQHMSELVREDQLTGSLNRRGLDDVFERETARSDRRGTPLCAALLDLDDFKRLNDTHGHQAGDNALKHLVKIVKDTLRSMDVIARFGGEEFLILLPETTIEAATATMTRLQRELTRHFFMHENEKLLITFSAGVALRKEGEDQASLVARADKAMYEAKRTGKNRVVVAS
jgi:diguanylate cyclase